MNEIKLCVAGSRTFNNYELLESEIKKIQLNNFHIKEIVSGTSRGADKLGEFYATLNDIPIVRFVPNWEKEGKIAGFIRNEKMAIYCDVGLLFWDGLSKGTFHMIETLQKYNKSYKVINF